jgi:drug/metabolite transporter (DMT)-like permease
MSGSVERLALLGAVLSVSTAAVFVRLADTPPLTVAAYRLALAALLFRALAGPGLVRELRRLDRAAGAAVLAAGALLAAHFGVWIASLSHTTLVNSVVIVATQPLFAAMASWWWLGEKPGAQVWTGMVLALGGCVILAGGGTPAAGDWLALAGAITAAAYLTLGRRVRGAMPLARYLAAVHGIAALCILPVAALAGPVLGLRPGTLVWLAALAVIPSLCGHGLLNYAVRRAPSYVVSLAILGEPIGAALLAWPVFGEHPSGRAVLGGAIILGGVALGVVRREGATAKASRPVVSP